MFCFRICLPFYRNWTHQWNEMSVILAALEGRWIQLANYDIHSIGQPTTALATVRLLIFMLFWYCESFWEAILARSNRRNSDCTTNSATRELRPIWPVTVPECNLVWPSLVIGIKGALSMWKLERSEFCHQLLTNILFDLSLHFISMWLISSFSL